MAGTQNIGESSDNPVAINVTAMVDVIFCLCLFFMCSFQFKQLEGKIESWLPKDRGLHNTADTPVLVREEIRITMSWDDAANATRLRVGQNDAFLAEAEMLAQVRQMRDEYTRAGKTGWPVVIDAEPAVPWKDVVHVADRCRREEIGRIEFTSPRA
jgi:biopolymer transport protein ExbD